MITPRKLVTLLISLLLAGCAGTTGAPGNPASTATPLNVDPIENLAAEFKTLRTQKGHFEGGLWNDDVDKWMGRKHQIMIELGSHLGTGEYSTDQVIDLLAPPDLIAREGDDFFELVSSMSEFEKPAAGSYELLIYYWRGTHDVLYFTAQGERIINSGWWYAGD